MAADTTLIARLDAQAETLDQLAFGQQAMAETLGTHTRLLERLIEAAETPPEQDSRLKITLRAILSVLKENTELLEALSKVLTGKNKP